MQQKRGGPLANVASYWRVIVGVSLSLALLISILAGVTLFNVFDTRFVITIFGSVVILRKILQQRFAYIHNSRTKRLIWAPIFEELRRRYPQDRDWLDKAERWHITYDDRRLLIQERYPQDLGDDSQWREFRRSIFNGARLPVGLVSPIYKVSFEAVRDLVRSIVDQSYPIDVVYLVVNGQWSERAKLLRQLRRLIAEIRQSAQTQTRFEIITLEEGNKRRAMRAGFEQLIQLLGEDAIISNSDSDTSLDMDAIANAIWTFLQRPEVVCLTGDVRIINPNVNFLSWMTAIRYFIAFNIERAAQSLFNQMTCLSGPFLAMRAKNLAQIMEPWANQTFLGQPCTFGDDRHLATLALLLGWVSIFVGEAICWTLSPTDRKEWIPQQLRWNKSADRENWILVVENKLQNLHWFIITDLLYLTVFPFLVIAAISVVVQRSIVALIAVVGQAASQAGKVIPILFERKEYVEAFYAMAYVGSSIWPGLMSGLYVLLPYIAIILAMNIVFQGVYGWRLTGNRKYLFSFAYIVYMPDLTILKVRAKLEARKVVWGTK